MLTSLSIRDVVLIEALDLEFEAGLGVLTGETGAGKSILLDALGLVLGDRADSGLVRHGCAQAGVTASFDATAPARALLADNDLSHDSGEPIILRRTVKADGGSRAWVNDQPVSATLLRELGGSLVEIHGQHDDRGLINPKGHRDLLDAFARSDTAGVATAWAAWRTVQATLASLRETLDKAASDREWLDHAVAELRSFAPEPGEEAELAERRQTMLKGVKLADELKAVRDLVEPGEAGLSKLRQAARILQRIAHEAPALTDALAALDRAVIEGSLAEDHLAAAARAFDIRPEDFEKDEARLFDLRALARKYRVQPDELATHAAELARQLEDIETGSDRLAQLEAEAQAARDAYAKAAKALSATRAEAAIRLDAAVEGELVPLKLDSARFRTLVEPLPESQWGPRGADRVEFMVATNPGAPFGPLIKIASGGETSRFILALKVALAEEGAAATMIFDEIDRGVGGAVASAIGERLARLARRTQLLVVTHSPQVAARGAVHFFIAKSSDGTVTRTGVRALDADERREEIARMLSGAEVTAEARAQAGRLLEGV
ncbi:MAG: DNA repair protein RecN [Sphingomonadales bacterium]|nr:DNA repair protein RecN [Sphingomonadales bacterium]